VCLLLVLLDVHLAARIADAIWNPPNDGRSYTDILAPVILRWASEPEPVDEARQ
jgi:hypothetical protein